MTYLSFQFVAFLILIFTIFTLAPIRFRKFILLFSSYIFYSFSSISFTFLLFFLTYMVFQLAKQLKSNTIRFKEVHLLLFGLASLVGILIFFKSKDLLDQLDHSFVGIQPNHSFFFNFVIPIGISYYLFKLIGYLLDVYWEKMNPENSFLSFGLYVSFFPQILSGPIQKAEDFFVQLDKNEIFDFDRVLFGLKRILFGLFKKLVIADPLVILISNVHGQPKEFSSLELLIGMYAFAIQLYTDFSGLTDIALGIGLLFGIKGPENFNLPFYSKNIQEFWRSWHISLTTWLGEYLFTPLQMSFKNLGYFGLSSAIFINMVVVGVWHGFTANFLIFGILNGIFLVISALTLKPRNKFFKRYPKVIHLRTILGSIITFNLISFTFIFFRSNSLDNAFSYLYNLFLGYSLNNVDLYRVDWSKLGITQFRFFQVLTFFIIMELVNFILKSDEVNNFKSSIPKVVQWVVIYTGLMFILLFGHLTNANFVYEQF